MQFGVKINVNKRTDILAEFQKFERHDIHSCQIDIGDTALLTDEWAEKINNAVDMTGMKISTFFCGYSGTVEYNFTYGPLTAGLVPPTYRASREQELIRGSEFAEKIHVNQMGTHVGFLPENSFDPDFRGTVSVLHHLCSIMKSRGQTFLFETGQETPTTLLRAIEEIGLDNVGVNFDTGNLIRYGKANPADAVLVLGPYIKDIHIKDGVYPTDGRNLGGARLVGEGMVDFELVFKRLQQIGYSGPYTIEHEISGEQQLIDILKFIDYLSKVAEKLGI